MAHRNSGDLGLTGGCNRTFQRTALRALQGDGLLVYVVRREDGLIKIGATADVVTRLRHVPHVQILAIRQGTRRDEREIHHSLRSSVAHGREYYRATPEVLAVVNDMRQDFNLPPITA